MKQKIKAEILERLEILKDQGLDEEIISRYVNENKVSFSVMIEDSIHNVEAFDYLPLLKQIVQRIEKSYNTHVYYGMANDMLCPTVFSFLVVNEDSTYWEKEKGLLREQTVILYNYIPIWNDIEAEFIAFEVIEGGMFRKNSITLD